MIIESLHGYALERKANRTANKGPTKVLNFLRPTLADYPFSAEPMRMALSCNFGNIPLQAIFNLWNLRLKNPQFETSAVDLLSRNVFWTLPACQQFLLKISPILDNAAFIRIIWNLSMALESSSTIKEKHFSQILENYNRFVTSIDFSPASANHRDWVLSAIEYDLLSGFSPVHHQLMVNLSFLSDFLALEAERLGVSDVILKNYFTSFYGDLEERVNDRVWIPLAPFLWLMQLKGQENFMAEDYCRHMTYAFSFWDAVSKNPLGYKAKPDDSHVIVVLEQLKTWFETGACQRLASVTSAFDQAELIRVNESLATVQKQDLMFSHLLLENTEEDVELFQKLLPTLERYLSKPGLLPLMTFLMKKGVTADVMPDQQPWSFECAPGQVAEQLGLALLAQERAYTYDFWNLKLFAEKLKALGRPVAPPLRTVVALILDYPDLSISMLNLLCTYVHKGLSGLMGVLQKHFDTGVFWKQQALRGPALSAFYEILLLMTSVPIDRLQDKKSVGEWLCRILQIGNQLQSADQYCKYLSLVIKILKSCVRDYFGDMGLGDAHEPNKYLILFIKHKWGTYTDPNMADIFHQFLHSLRDPRIAGVFESPRFQEEFLNRLPYNLRLGNWHYVTGADAQTFQNFWGPIMANTLRACRQSLQDPTVQTHLVFYNACIRALQALLGVTPAKVDVHAALAHQDAAESALRLVQRYPLTESAKQEFRENLNQYIATVSSAFETPDYEHLMPHKEYLLRLTRDSLKFLLSTAFVEARSRLNMKETLHAVVSAFLDTQNYLSFQADQEDVQAQISYQKNVAISIMEVLLQCLREYTADNGQLATLIRPEIKSSIQRAYDNLANDPDYQATLDPTGNPTVASNHYAIRKIHSPSCDGGSFNRLLYVLNGIHPDVQVRVVNTELVLDKLRAVFAQSWLQFVQEHSDLNLQVFVTECIFDSFDLSNPTHLEIWEGTLKDKIHAAINDEEFAHFFRLSNPALKENILKLLVDALPSIDLTSTACRSLQGAFKDNCVSYLATLDNQEQAIALGEDWSSDGFAISKPMHRLAFEQIYQSGRLQDHLGEHFFVERNSRCA
ncbi:MAG: hypothetical protein RLZ35_1083 [Pseudomonadota bacterium]|jgi:hypothetical protein